MTYQVTVIWKIFWRLPFNSQVPSSLAKTKAFDVRTGKSVLREAGGSINADFFPSVLEPTGPFFSKVSRVARDEKITLEKTRFSATGVDKLANFEFSGAFSIHLYDTQLCLSVELESIRIQDAGMVAPMTDLDNHLNIKALAIRIADVVAKELTSNPLLNADNPKVYPCSKIVAQHDAPPLSLNLLTEILTRHKSPNLDVVEDVYSKNRSHQVDGTHVLLDRQGLVAYAAPTTHTDEKESCERRFRSCSALLELAAAGQRLLLEPNQSSLLPALAVLASDPKSAIPNSVSASRAWVLFVSEFNLTAARQYEPVREAVESVNQQSEAEPTLVLCIVAATVELEAVHHFLTNRFGKEEKVRLENGADYYLRYYDISKKVTWCVVPLSFQGQVEAASDTRYLCTLLNPTLIFMVGMCMSMKSNIEAGTVIVPNEVMVFDHERLTLQGTQVRPHGDRVDHGLFKLARLFAATQTFPFRVLTDKGLASAMSKVENPAADLITFIKTSFPDASAFDMEGWGFYRGAAGRQCLWIKAVADSGEAQGHERVAQDAKRSTQTEVSVHAIEFAADLVDEFLNTVEHRSRT